MVPFPMLPTESSAERRLYEGFLEQLDDAYVVYHSVPWVLDERGVREEGEADFVISHPQHGILAVEAKGGEMTYEPAQRRWYSAGRTGRHPIDDDPFEQAKGEMHSLIQILEDRPAYERWRPSFGYAVAFPDGVYDEPAHPGAPTDIVIDRRHLDGLADRVHRIMDGWRRPGRRFGVGGMEQLASALGLRVEISTPLKWQFDQEDVVIVELTDDQAWILSYITHRRRAAVTGPAGCGKTLLAVEIARKLAAGGIRTLLTCFNKALATDLRHRTEGTRHLEVAHFHELAWNVAREAGLDLPDEDELPEETEFFDRRLPELLAEGAELLGPRYQAIVVDEAQDFLEDWWDPLLALHEEPEEGWLYLFADDNQNLYGGTFPVENMEMCPPLPHNVRNTRRIHRFVSVFHRGESDPAARGPEGRDVEILGYRDDRELRRLLGVVLRNLAEERVPPEDIAVLTPPGKRKSRLRADPNVDGFRLSETPAPGAVLASSIHGFKGLEAPVVILAELGDKHLEDLDRYLYVGGSRARSHLIVLATEPVARELRRRVGIE
jgi:UvrD-like helicase C-terminal domain/AAA domain